MYQPTVRQSMAWDNGTVRSDWNFDTIRTSSAMGTFSNMMKDLELTPEALEDDDFSVYDEEQSSIDSGGATKGSNQFLSSGIGANSQAAQSTVIIKRTESSSSEKDMVDLLASEGSPVAPVDPLGAPPAYTGSVRSSRRASYTARTSLKGPGTIVNEADIGTGVDTIRPIKKVDPVGSLRLSAEFVGSMRRDGSGSAPTSPTTHTRIGSEIAKAGRAVVDDVVVPILQKVRIFFFRF